jgi:hypothetical protein
VRASDDAELVDAATGLLHAAYPRVVIHRRDPIAEFRLDNGVTWYVYRDGSPTGGATAPRSPAPAASHLGLE